MPGHSSRDLFVQDPGRTRFQALILGSREPRKKTSYFPLYWLVNRDPYSGLL